MSESNHGGVTTLLPPNEPEQNPLLPEKKKKSKVGPVIAIGSVAAAGALAATLFIGGNVLHQNTNNAPEKSPDDTSDIQDDEDTTEEETPVEQEATFDPAVGLEVDNFTDDAELGKALFEGAFTEWINAGATQENTDELYSITSNYTSLDYSIMIAAETDSVFIDSLFAPGWETDPQTFGVIDRVSTAHQQVLDLYFVTNSGIEEDDEEPYRKESHLEVQSSSRPDSETIIYNVEQRYSDNDELNRAAELTDGNVIDESLGATSKMEVTLKIIDGKYKIVSIRY